MLVYGARFYDPAVGRFTTIDPLGDQGGQQSWSGYHYVLDNPIKLIDPDGKIYKDSKDVKTHNRLTKKAARRERKFERKTNRTLNKVFKAIDNGNWRKESRLNKKLNESAASKNEMRDLQAELFEMGTTTEEVFTFNQETEGTGLTYRSTTDIINGKGVIVLEANTDALRIHEAKHGFQILKGEIKANGGKKQNVAYIRHEVEAYRRQHAFAPNTIPNSKKLGGYSHNTITGPWVRGIFYLDSNGEEVFPY